VKEANFKQSECSLLDRVVRKAGGAVHVYAMNKMKMKLDTAELIRNR